MRGATNFIILYKIGIACTVGEQGAGFCIYLFIFEAIAVPISFAFLHLPSLLYEYIVDAVSILRKLAFVL